MDKNARTHLTVGPIILGLSGLLLLFQEEIYRISPLVMVPASLVLIAGLAYVLMFIGYVVKLIDRDLTGKMRRPAPKEPEVTYEEREKYYEWRRR